MTESEFQNFLKGLHIIDRKIVDIAYLSTPDEEERQKRLASLLKKAEQLQAHTEEIERLWNEAAAKVEEGRKEWLKGTFTPFTPPDESKKSLFPVNRLPDGIKEMVTAIAESLQVPPDMPATAALGVDESKRLLTSRDHAKVMALVKKRCANYDAENHECLMMNGYGCALETSLHLCCNYFRDCVLPLDKQLYDELTALETGGDTKRCAVCRKQFIPGSNRAKYCPICAKKDERLKHAKRQRKYRDKT